MKKITGKILALCLTMALAGVCFTACGKQEAPEDGVEWGDGIKEDSTVSDLMPSGEGQEENLDEDEASQLPLDYAEDGTLVQDDVVVRIGGLSGPTSMALVNLKANAASNTTNQTYEFADFSTDPSAFVAPLTKGEIDIAAIPSNLASVVYNNTQGGVKVIAINTLGVLSIVERGDSISSISDLNGKTVYATGQGATPEFVLRYIVSQNGMDFDKDINVQWCADTTEALSYIAEDEEAIAMLPQPFVTAAQMQVEDLHVAIDLNDAWDQTEASFDGSKIVTGVFVVRTEFANQHPNAIAQFFIDYGAAIAYSIENVTDTAARLEQEGIVGKAAIAEKALPNCNLCFIVEKDMKNTLAGYLQVLYDLNPQSVGGNLPNDDFYYGN